MLGVSMTDYTKDFDIVATEEFCQINAWRTRNGRPGLTWSKDSNEPSGAVGIALSGGGIRSAAFGLGALQALDQDLTNIARKQSLGAAGTDEPLTGMACVDYVSTVSGGGYIGTSLRLGMDRLNGQFPFSTGTGDKRDNLAIGHIRNHSKYLIPNGLPDVISDIAIILRGLAANLVMIAGVILILAGITGWANPSQTEFLLPDLLGFKPFPYQTAFMVALGPFATTSCLLLLGFAGFVCWGITRSQEGASITEFQGPWHKASVAWIIVTVFSAFIEFQPYAAQGLFAAYGSTKASSFSGVATSWVAALVPYAAPAAAAFAFLGRIFGDTLKTHDEDEGLMAKVAPLIAKLAASFVALMLPLTIWVIYLHITLLTDIGFEYRPAWLQHFVESNCGGKQDIGSAYFKTLDLSELGAAKELMGCKDTGILANAFFWVGWLIFLPTFLLTGNANSLHRLYRDRLSKAFLFDPGSDRATASIDSTGDLAPAGDTLFKALTASNGPLHLVNTAINLQGSKHLNRLGRNADFFVFSSAYFGSKSTGFLSVQAPAAQKMLPDLGTAMAISGAAASSNMGGNTIRGFSPTLALLNIRLGYWMDNPAFQDKGGGPVQTSWEKFRGNLGLYLAEEMLSLLDERAAKVYLTDGGHIENLGLYELLRRRCKTIVVIDAEADPNMAFGSFVDAQRMARIDLGIRIDLNWEAIRLATLACNAAFKKGERPTEDEGRQRPHTAIGTIDYGGSKKGTLIYVKSSVTGDENDYIRAYKAKNASFPHETTGDQFFSEEQFEAYRALGFHALHSAFTGKAKVEGLKAVPKPTGKIGIKSASQKAKRSAPKKLADFFIA